MAHGRQDSQEAVRARGMCLSNMCVARTMHTLFYQTTGMEPARPQTPFKDSNMGNSRICLPDPLCHPRHLQQQRLRRHALQPHQEAGHHF